MNQYIKGETIKAGNNIIGASTKCKVVKNKVAPPFKECTFDLMYGSGISRTGEVLDLAVDLDIIKKGGSWFSYKDQKLGQGRDNVKELLQNDEKLMKEIEEQILARKDELNAAPAKKSKPAEKAVVSEDTSAFFPVPVSSFFLSFPMKTIRRTIPATSTAPRTAAHIIQVFFFFSGRFAEAGLSA